MGNEERRRRAGGGRDDVTADVTRACLRAQAGGGAVQNREESVSADCFPRAAGRSAPVRAGRVRRVRPRPPHCAARLRPPTHVIEHTRTEGRGARGRGGERGQELLAGLGRRGGPADGGLGPNELLLLLLLLLVMVGTRQAQWQAQRQAASQVQGGGWQLSVALVRGQQGLVLQSAKQRWQGLVTLVPTEAQARQAARLAVKRNSRAELLGWKIV